MALGGLPHNLLVLLELFRKLSRVSVRWYHGLFLSRSVSISIRFYLEMWVGFLLGYEKFGGPGFIIVYIKFFLRVISYLVDGAKTGTAKHGHQGLPRSNALLFLY